ncbi:hypothetical protein A3F38_02365 [Candidatus Saccharibacteria bacterium RIFCSPHIGHO2_12_FULL_48_21]|nr:MAG: hypothetical protein A3F38_02365 [Candidatus Saccharibacteria bacterium RIFCSPHIGHO2_12_FULL_48_21]
MKRKIYLDFAAATPMDSQVVAAMKPYFTDLFHNPSAIYLDGRAANSQLQKYRKEAAQILGAKPAEIIFTSGATESNNLAIAGIMDRYPNAKLAVSAIEHESVLEPAKLYNHQLIPVSPGGIVEVSQLEKKISDNTVLISIMMINNEIGSLQPLKDISARIEQIRVQRREANNKLPLYLHTDAAQAGNLFDLHVSRLGVDLMTINGGKIYGPKQSGLLYARAGVELKAQILGGGQEFGRRSGTESLAAIAGLVTAIKLAQNNRKISLEKTKKLTEVFATQLQKALPEVGINRDKKYHSPHIISATFPGYDNERLLMELDEAGIAVGTGSACSASKENPSHVLAAIGLSDRESRSTLRFSFGKSTTAEDLAYVIQKLSQITSPRQ